MDYLSLYTTLPSIPFSLPLFPSLTLSHPILHPYALPLSAVLTLPTSSPSLLPIQTSLLASVAQEWGAGRR